MRQKTEKPVVFTFALKNAFLLESEAQPISPKMASRAPEDTGRKDGVLLFLLFHCRLATPLICGCPPRDRSLFVAYKVDVDMFYVLRFGGNLVTFCRVSSDVSRHPLIMLVKIAGRCR